MFVVKFVFSIGLKIVKPSVSNARFCYPVLVFLCNGKEKALLQVMCLINTMF